MEYLSVNTADIVLMFVFIIVFGFFIITAFCFEVILPFMEARNYIKTEMQRSDGKEYYYWKNELKRLYKAHIPIIGRFFR